MKDLINLTGNLSFDEAKAIIGDYMSVLCVAEKGVLNYAAKPIDKQKHLQTNGRWNGVVWYSDEQGAKKRRSFYGTTKQEVKEKRLLPTSPTSTSSSWPQMRQSQKGGKHEQVALGIQISLRGTRYLRLAGVYRHTSDLPDHRR